MQKLITSIKREFWEQSRSFIALSSILGGLFILAACGGVVLMWLTGSSWSFHITRLIIDPDKMIGGMLHAVAAPFLFILWITVFNYFLSSLYDDRQDRSVLFWMSMPVSTQLTIFSKVFTGLIVAPFMASIGIALTSFLISLVSLAAPLHATLWQNLPIFHPVAFFIDWFMLLVSMWMQAVWLFPLFAWCMFCSAYARKAPFLRAIIWPLIIMMFEFFILRTGYLIYFIRSRFTLAGFSWKHYSYFTHHNLITNQSGLFSSWPGVHMQWNPLLSMSFTQNILIGTAVGLVFVILAAIFRHRCYGFDR